VPRSVGIRSLNRRASIRESDAPILMGCDEGALIRLWREKRGAVVSKDASADLVVQLDTATKEINRSWYELKSGRRVGETGRRVKHCAISWMVATLDGIVEGIGAVFAAKFVAQSCYSEPGLADRFMAELQHQMWVTHLRTCVLSVITGGGQWVEAIVPMDPLYLTLLVSAEKKFWRCVQSGEVPHLVNAEVPRPRVEPIHIADMRGSTSWAELAALYHNTHEAFLKHERAKRELALLMPDAVDEAIGHGVRAVRSTFGAVSLDIMKKEIGHAANE
jgi:predicted phage-related endonuclease